MYIFSLSLRYCVVKCFTVIIINEATLLLTHVKSFDFILYTNLKKKRKVEKGIISLKFKHSRDAIKKNNGKVVDYLFYIVNS